MRLNYKRTFLIGLAFLSISAFWQMYDNVIPLILKNSFGIQETVTGAIMGIDNILALFLLPVFGAFSDKVNTRIGRRMPFILLGTLFSVILLVILPIADNTRNLVLFIGGLFLVLVCMGTYRSPAVALMPDLTPKPLRSKANSIINLMGAVGGVYALAMIKLLVGKGKTPNYMPLFLSIGILMVVCVAVLFFTIKENKLRAEVEKEIADVPEPETEKTKAEVQAEKLPKDVKRSLIFMLLSVAFWFIAYNAVTTAFSRYATEIWKLEEGGYADVLMIAMVAAIISYIPIGFILVKLDVRKAL